MNSTEQAKRRKEEKKKENIKGKPFWLVPQHNHLSIFNTLKKNYNLVSRFKPRL